MLEKEFDYFIAHKDEIIKNYTNKYVVIVGETLVDVYDSKEIAYIESSKKYELGSFLIKYCDFNEESYIQSFNSRAIFV